MLSIVESSIFGSLVVSGCAKRRKWHASHRVSEMLLLKWPFALQLSVHAIL
jgi:hypothetical protein